ncbi:unnamed protein product [Dovyalis caffra]|uniref:Uncharacterized protein n=1 Tax=Dovyalis caffra TaxID=77055 RepID=A0AAV1R801_9ROSI|nr:unnamed protein product [Dovyalis caffra]
MEKERGRGIRTLERWRLIHARGSHELYNCQFNAFPISEIVTGEFLHLFIVMQKPRGERTVTTTVLGYTHHTLPSDDAYHV